MILDEAQLQKDLGRFVRRVLEANAEGRLISFSTWAGQAATTLPDDAWESAIPNGAGSFTFHIGPFNDLARRVAAAQDARQERQHAQGKEADAEGPTPPR